MRDPYDMLGVSRSASEDDIKKSFRRLAKKFHPDQNQNDPKAKDAFSEINAAYEILGDKAKRAQFDRGEIGADGKPRMSGFEGFSQDFGSQGFQGFAGGRARGRAHAGAGVDADDFISEILGQAFGGRRARPGAGANGGRGFGFEAHAGGAGVRGEDVQVTVEITLEDLAGQGKVRVGLPNGKTLDVQLPEAAASGQQIRLKGQGQPGTPTGDAIVTLQIRPHAQFRVEGIDLRHDLAVSLEEAVLGARVRVPTLEGPVDLTLPAGTTGAKALRLKGKGLPVKGGSRGDLYVHPRITLPEAGDAELEAFLRMRKRR